ncbi:2Fe-2S iron-sulfur cluster-binding protein [Candidatus Poriferisodalis sp.]|uniref:2Fe-2S iron-sulfur cluster-binding protein n=1 Tax=Candidatus Poriferisodalis sp. TaxID=3101277 RepID=UPI003B017F17
MSAGPEPAPARLASGLISRSHLGIEPFEMRRPDSLADAAAAVADGSWAHAGGIDVAQRLRAGQAADELVPLCRPPTSAGTGLEMLGEISLGDGCLFIGAAVTHARIESDPLVQAHRPDVAATWRTIGNVRIRAAGTLGGNLAAFHPGYDAAPILAAAEATVVVAEPDGTLDRCSVADLPQHRLIVGCEVPLSGQVVFDRSLKPVVSVAVGDQAVAIGCAYAYTVVIPHGATRTEDVAAALAALADPINDAFATAAYRRRMIGVLVDRCLRAHAEPPVLARDDRMGVPATRPASTQEVAPPDARSLEAAPPARSQDVQSPDDVSRDGAGSTTHVEMHLNGEPFAVAAPPSEMLVDTIRTRAGLDGTRVGCDQAVCGTCTVLVDDMPAASCSTFTWQADDTEVLTIESASDPDSANARGDVASILPAVQGAFAKSSAFQCGYCTPGLILVAAALLARHRDPDRATICDWLDSNVCRCTGYLMVIEAVEAAAAALAGHASADSSSGSAA